MFNIRRLIGIDDATHEPPARHPAVSCWLQAGVVNRALGRQTVWRNFDEKTYGMPKPVALRLPLHRA